MATTQRVKNTQSIETISIEAQAFAEQNKVQLLHITS